MSNEPRDEPTGSSEQADETSARSQAPPRRRPTLFPAARAFLLLIAVVLLGVFWNPLAVRYRQSRARTMLDKRHDAAALVPLRTALQGDLENSETLLLLARAHRRLGHLPKVSLLLDQAAVCGGEPQRIERERQLLLAQSGHVRQAEPFLPDLLMNPGNDGPDICQAFVQGYFANLRNGDAERILDVWQQSFPNDAQVYFMRGYLMQSMDDPTLAEKLYRKGLELAPEQTMMRRRLANVLLKSGQLDKAETELMRCVEQSPENADVYFALARCAYERGDMTVTTSRLEETLQRDLNHIDARLLKGQLDLAEGNLDEAFQELEAVVKQRPYDLLAREALARTLRLLDRNDEAQPHFDYVAKGQLSVDRVNRLLREAFAKPTDANVRFEIGTIMMRYGPPEDAARWMRATLQLQPDHTGAHRALADYYKSQGDAAGAAFHQQRAAMDQQKP